MFGGRSLTLNPNVRRGNPGSADPRGGSWIQMPPVAAPATHTDPPLPFPFDAADESIDVSVAAPNRAMVSRRIDLPLKRNVGQPVTMIAIAPDSNIECADIQFGSNRINRHRIAPGAPYIGTPDSDDDFALVAPVRMIPALSDTNSANPIRSYAFWDARVDADPAGAGVNGLCVGWPLRLNVYRGDQTPPVMVYRAPLTAVCVFQTSFATATPGQQDFFVCTDGRRRVDVNVARHPLSGAASMTVQIDGIDTTMLQNNDAPSTGSFLTCFDPSGQNANSVVNLLPATALAAGASMVKSYTGNPFWMFRVRVQSTATFETSGTIQVLGWDY
jgi:hypothetical protein